MSEKPWVKWYPSDFLHGVTDLEPEEVCVYVIVLNLIYDADGPISLDVARWCKRCNMRAKAFERALHALLNAGKLLQSDDLIYNGRAKNVIEKRQKASGSAQNSANARWANAKTKPKENKATHDANPMRPLCGTDAILEARDEIELVSSDEDTRSFEVPDGGEFFDFDLPIEAKAVELKPARPKSTTDTKREATDAFPKWWMLYPRKVGKGGALIAYHRAWKRIGPGAADILTAGVYQLTNETAGEEKKFIPHATTWLNEERWTDEPGARGSGAGGNTRAGKGMGSGAYAGGGRPGFGTMADVFFARERAEQERDAVSRERASILHPALASPDD